MTQNVIKSDREEITTMHTEKKKTFSDQYYQMVQMSSRVARAKRAQMGFEPQTPVIDANHLAKKQKNIPMTQLSGCIIHWSYSDETMNCIICICTYRIVHACVHVYIHV